MKDLAGNEFVETVTTYAAPAPVSDTPKTDHHLRELPNDYPALVEWAKHLERELNAATNAAPQAKGNTQTAHGSEVSGSPAVAAPAVAGG